MPPTYYQCGAVEEGASSADGSVRTVAYSANDEPRRDTKILRIVGVACAVLAAAAVANHLRPSGRTSLIQAAVNSSLSEASPASPASASSATADTLQSTDDMGTSTNFARTGSHPLVPDSELWGDLSAPYPTGAWWLNFALPGDAFPAVAYPYAVRAQSEAIELSYSASRKLVEADMFSHIFAPDLTFRVSSPISQHYISSYDQLSVSLTYETEDECEFTLFFVKGAPYATIKFSECSPVISPLATFETVNDVIPFNWIDQSVEGSSFTLKLSTGQTWLLFTDRDVEFDVGMSHMSLSSEPFSGVLRVAFLDDPEDADTLEAHSGSYPVGGSVDWEVEGDDMKLTYTWDVEGGPETDLLMLALPHHVETMEDEAVGGNLLSQGAFECIKGVMTPILGSTWTMVDTLTPMDWSGDIGEQEMNPEWAETIREKIVEDVIAIPPIAPDLYDFGKQVARLARIGLIAKEMGDEESYNLAVSDIPTYLEPWLNGENPDALVYDTEWGGLVSTFGILDSYADFGHGFYNDHHFQQGYVLYAAAVAAKYDSSFYEQFKTSIDMIVEDIACRDTHSADFPFARHKDMYDWHSWASGLFPSGNGKSQESISEAINAYYAVSLLGDATEDNELRDWGRLLAHMELKAAHLYWQMGSDNPVYSGAEKFAANRMAGVVGALDVSARTWFGDNKEYVHGINMMPFTPITQYLLQPQFVSEEYEVISSTLDRRDDPPEEQWLSFIFLDEAVIDPQSAWDKITSVKTLDGGNSMTNALYWIATRPDPQQG